MVASVFSTTCFNGTWYSSWVQDDGWGNF